ncbi:uncharacterized protein EpC_pEp360250 (plasmid) [Erwinia pyrifoliae Ep1/96]|nr:hypothetical protein CPI84_19475 [Erwinia pyrifoliae]CAX53427.1 uncharacterized protein EpC_pEp360250 [Erwinia pyrifoliae Ep1/96]
MLRSKAWTRYAAISRCMATFSVFFRTRLSAPGSQGSNPRTSVSDGDSHLPGLRASLPRRFSYRPIWLSSCSRCPLKSRLHDRHLSPFCQPHRLQDGNEPVFSKRGLTYSDLLCGIISKLCEWHHYTGWLQATEIPVNSAMTPAMVVRRKVACITGSLYCQQV